MHIREMTTADINAVLPLYISYYNVHEGGSWTKETAEKRIHQVICTEDSFSLILEENNYDDIIGYTLEEIVIAYEHQNKGVGSAFLSELERIVREKGASCVELQAVSDEHHERFYEKAGYRNAKNFVMKVKWFE